MPTAPLTREPVHPADTRPHPGLTLAWRARRRELASGCRYWSTRPLSAGGDPRLAVAADCLEDERDLTTAFAPLATWFGMPPAHPEAWSVTTMLARVAHPDPDRLTRPDPYAVLAPHWDLTPVVLGVREGIYHAALRDGVTTFRLLWEPRSGDPLPGLQWTRNTEQGVVPVRTAMRRQGADRAAWWDWLYVQAAAAAFMTEGRRVSLTTLDYLVLPGLPWRTA